MCLISSKVNNMILRSLLAIFVIIITGCTTSKSTVSNHADLSRYEYACVINNDSYHIPAELMEYEIQLFDAVESSRLQLISDYRIDRFTPQQKNSLLMVKYGVNQRDEETVVIVNFIDFMTGRPIASCRGAYSSLGVAGASHDIREAIKRVARQISDTFPKNKR